jgi:hypothetical protein
MVEYLLWKLNSRHVEIVPVILSAAKDLFVCQARSFAALRMTGRRQDTSQVFSRKASSPHIWLNSTILDSQAYDKSVMIL